MKSIDKNDPIPDDSIPTEYEHEQKLLDFILEKVHDGLQPVPEKLLYKEVSFGKALLSDLTLF